ncbi:outer membrane protein assembly factor BamB [Ottowia sp.]|uniref:outer membrane protein assembly factor BamB n=1 Tax=Ottowia sp. TaxID=1898956 RepID=UPI003A837CDD
MKTLTGQTWRRWPVAGAALLVLAVLAGCAGGSKRPEPAELPPNVAVLGVRQAWVARATEVAFPLEVHVAGQQVALAGSDGTVLTLDAATGQTLGRAQVGEALSGGVGSDGQVTAVVTRVNEVVALSGGREIWRHRLGTQSYTAPLVAGGRVFVLGADRSLTGMDGQTGAVLWNVQRTTEPLVLRQAGVLTAVGNTLVAGLSGRLVGVNPDNGSILWEAPVASARGTNDVERLVDLVGGVSRQANVVCTRAFQAAVGCVDTHNGQVQWTRQANGATGISGDGERLYGTEGDGRVMAWNAQDGGRAWVADDLQWRFLTGTLVLGSAVVFGDSTGLVHLRARADGKPLNRLRTDGSGIAATPVLAGNTLVVVTRKGAVYGFVLE